MGYFLIEMLITSLSEIERILSAQASNKNVHHLGNQTKSINQHRDYFNKRNIQSLLNYLQSKDNQDKSLFHKTPPASHEWITHTETLTQVSRNVLYRSHSICHTALLPSQTRYQGILTESYKDPNHETFDLGTNKFYLRPVEDGILPLVWDPNDRQKCEALEIDHKDFFFVRTDDDWVSAVVPNPSELQVYGTWGKTLSKREGLIMVCLRYCPFRKCQSEYVGFDALQKGVLSIKVDGKPVIGTKQLDECFFLQGHQGIRWGTERDHYEVSFKIEPKTGKWMKVTSIIIF